MQESDIVFDDMQAVPPKANGVELLNPYKDDRASAPALIEASAAIAEMQTARLMARQFPRDRRLAVDRLLIECTVPDLANRAVYSYVRGGEEVTGPTIRLAEAVARNWGNLRSGVRELSREPGISWVKSYAIDLESGFEDERVFQVRHWRDTKSGGYALKNDRDIREIVANYGARAKRSCIETIIPREVFRVAVEQCATTQAAHCDTSVETVEKMLGLFAMQGVEREHIIKKIGRNLDAITPAHMVLLRRIYNGLADGLGVPGDYFPELAEKATKEAEDPRAGTSLDEYRKRAQDKEPAPYATTFEDVRTAVEKATTVGALDAAQSLIPSIEDEVERLRAADLIALKRSAITP
jgi:hypothetical protein